MHRANFEKVFQALQSNVAKYESQYGELKIRTPLSPWLTASDAILAVLSEKAETASTPASKRESPSRADEPEESSQSPDLAGLYDQLKLPDDLLAGTFANGVMITHMAEEFCIDFMVNSYPRSLVVCRIFIPAGRVPSLLETMRGAIHGSYED